MRIHATAGLVICVFAALHPVLAHGAITTVTLDPAGLTSMSDNWGATYTLAVTQPAGSGVFDPFVRIQREGTAQGYNSSVETGPDATMDVINLPGNASPTLVMSSVVDGQRRLGLSLDYNEQGSSGKRFLTLDELVLVVSTDANKSGPAGPGPKDSWSIQGIPMTAGDQVIYQMSAGSYLGSNYILGLTADKVAGGSGKSDLSVTIDLFRVPNISSMTDSTHYLYVYSRFGNAGAGFEEWSAFLPGSTSTTPTIVVPGVPEPASLMLLSLGAAGLLVRRRKQSPLNH